MSDYERLLHLIGEVQARVAQLAEEMRRLQAGQNDREAQVLDAPPNTGEVPPGGFDPDKVIPPTPTDEPESIIGGLPTRDFPDCCAVGSDRGYFCTGTLIAPRLVVTAKHCNNITRVFLKGFDVSQPEGGETIPVEAQHQHPEVDLKLLVLQRPSTVTPRHVAQGREVRGTEALLVGFGTTDFGGRLNYGLKRHVTVPIASLGCDAPAAPDQHGCKAGKELVAGHRGLNKDSCRGDSGGPLYVLGDDGGYHLLGATSRGARGGRLCGDGGIYVRVDQFLDWIRETAGALSDTIEGPFG